MRWASLAGTLLAVIGPLFDKLAELLIQRRRAAAVLIAIACLVAAAAALQLRVDFSIRDLFPSDDPELAGLADFEGRWGTDDNRVLILLSGDDVFREAPLRWLHEASARLEDLDAVARVVSLRTVAGLRAVGDTVENEPLLERLPESASARETLRADVRRNQLLSGRVVTTDDTATVIVAEIDPTFRSVRQIAEAVRRIEATLGSESVPRGFSVDMIGVPVVRSDVVDLIVADQFLFIPLGGLFTVIVLVWLYRSWQGLIVPVAAVAGSLAAAVGGMVMLGVPIDFLTNVVPVLVIIYGVADAIHMLNRAQEERRRGASPEVAVRRMVRHLGVACGLTSLTTAIGFASLASSSLPVMQRFGLLAAGGVLAAYVVTLAIVPVGAIIVVDRRSGEEVRAPFSASLERLGALLVRRPRVVLLIAVLLGVGAVAVGSRIQADNQLLDVYGPDHPRRAATRLAEEKLQGVVSLNVAVEGDHHDPQILAGLRSLQTELASYPAVTGSLSYADVLEEMHRAFVGTRELPATRELASQLSLLIGDGFDDLVTPERDAGRMRIELRDIGAVGYLGFVDRVRARISAHLPEGSAVVTGQALLGYRGVTRVVRTLVLSLSLALGIIALVLIAFFRSVKVGLMSLIPNSIPLAVGLFVMAVSGLDLDPTTVLVFSVALGIAVDDTIHFVARYREEMERGVSVEDAVRATLATAGQAMVVTSAILVSGFAILLLSNFPSTQSFGFVGMVVFAAALVTDLVVTPVCLLTFRPWANAPRRSMAS